MTFEAIPAIDIHGGRCVRLVQGDFERETVYDQDPVAVARHWEQAGAPRLHVVDLDGARDGTRANASVVAALLRAVRIPVQVGGGIRTLDTGHTLIEQGADRVILGTAAVEERDRLGEWLEALGPERLVVGVDARNGRVATRGWLEQTDLDVVAFGRRLAELGILRVLYTDIGRDGMLGGPDAEGVTALARQTGLRVLGSGGVSTIEHLHALERAGAEGAIVGKALYDGRLEPSTLFPRSPQRGLGAPLPRSPGGERGPGGVG